MQHRLVITAARGRAAAFARTARQVRRAALRRWAAGGLAVLLVLAAVLAPVHDATAGDASICAAAGDAGHPDVTPPGPASASEHHAGAPCCPAPAMATHPIGGTTGSAAERSVVHDGLAAAPRSGLQAGPPFRPPIA